MAALCAAVWALAGGVAPAQATTQTFTYTGGEQTFKVPGGVGVLFVTLIGGHGGDATDSVGGAADEVSGALNVIPGETLYVEVGGVGEDLGAGGGGGFNGGGSGAGGGGGATDIRTVLRSTSLLVEDSRLAVAGGGGGGGGSGLSGEGSDGGAAGSPGASSEGYAGGGAGTQVSGGEGASGCLAPGEGQDGVLGEGGAGGNSGAISAPGGGGGGGYYGGGGGGGACEIGSSGGGGGSSLVPPSEGLVQTASPSAEPLVEIAYTLVPPSIAIVSPANGATYTQGEAVPAIYSCTPPEGTSVKTCAGPVANGAPLDTSSLGPHTFAVNAEDTDGATAFKSVSYTVVAPPPPNTTPAPSTTPLGAVLPNTALGSHPGKNVKTNKKKAKVKFSFSSDVVGATFQCKLDKGAFAPCTSPKGYKVKPGKHKFSVEAVSAGGVDPTPASFSFKVKKTD